MRFQKQAKALSGPCVMDLDYESVVSGQPELRGQLGLTRGQHHSGESIAWEVWLRRSTPKRWSGGATAASQAESELIISNV